MTDAAIRRELALNNLAWHCESVARQIEQARDSLTRLDAPDDDRLDARLILNAAARAVRAAMTRLTPDPGPEEVPVADLVPQVG